MRAPDLQDEDGKEFSYLEKNFPDDVSCCGRTNLHRRPKKTKESAAAQFAARRPATASAAQTVKPVSSTAMQTQPKPQQQQKQQPTQLMQQPRVLKPRQALLRLERRLSRRPDPDADAFASPWVLRQRARALDALLAPTSAAGSRSSTASGGSSSCQLYDVWERVPTAPSPEEATSSCGNVTTSATSTTTVSKGRCRTAVSRTTSGCGAIAASASGMNEQRELRPVSCYGNRRARPVMTLVDFVASAAVRVQNFSFPSESSSAQQPAQQQRQQQTLLRPVRRPATFDRCCVSPSADSGETPARMPRQQRLAGTLAISGLKS